MPNTGETKVFFEGWSSYRDVATGKCDVLYRNIRAELQGRLAGRVLDIGSGGVVNYDLADVERLVVADLASIDVPVSVGQGGSDDSAFRGMSCVTADARALPFSGGSFDRVMLQLLIHHLAEDSVAETEASVRACLREARRVLRPGGRIIIVESCVPVWLERVEDAGYQVFRRGVKLLRHPMVKQFAVRSLRSMVMGEGFGGVVTVPIVLGRYVIQFGIVVPAVLSPSRVFLLEGTKRV